MLELILYHLRSFPSVAQNRSYSKAGEELSLSQPAVSRQIAALEKGLGLDLFSQRGRQIVLTDAGRTLYDYADRIISLVQQANRVMAQYHDLEQGEVRLGANPLTGCYILPSILRDFQSRFPKIKVSLQLSNAPKLAQWITDGRLDLAVTSEPVENNNIHLERYIEDDLVLVYPPEEINIEIDKLFAKYPLITKGKDSLTGIEIEKHLAKHSISPKSYLEISDHEVMKNMVMAGIGVTFLPLRAVKMELDLSRLKTVSGEGASLTRWVYLLISKDQHYCPALLAFMSFIRKYQ